MAVRRPLIIDGGSIKELPSGDTLPAPGKTAATLSHTAGAITLDVQAADLYRFEADAYTAGEITVVGVAQSRNAGDFSIPGPPIEDDVVLLLTGAYGALTVPAGWDEIFRKTSTIRSMILSKRMGSTPDTTIDVSQFTDSAFDDFHVFTLRGVSESVVLDAPLVSSLGVSGNTDPPAITTVTPNALVIASSIDNHAGFTGQSIAGYTATPGGMNQNSFRKVVSTAGAENPGSVAGTSRLHNDFTLAIRPAASSGEKDYTITFSNIPSSGLASGTIDLELKTDTGSVAFAGGTVNWRGTVPAFDAVGHYLIGFIADSTGITLWREA